MRFTVAMLSGHTELCAAVAWSPDSSLFSCADDRAVIKWSTDGEASSRVGATESYVSSITWFPGLAKQAPEMFAVSCADGTMRFMSRSGREEKKVAAHEGAAIVVRWSHDGSAILTAGEDGDVKIWSKSGNLRSTLVSTGRSVYSACWGPDDDQVLVASGKTLMIKTVQATKKSIEWVAHDGIVLCVDWNVANSNIVSGGEDCTYRIWDAYGRQLYCSRPMEHVVTSIGWSPNGECFAVGSFNTLRLCDKTGWSHSKERLSCGSVMGLAWTADSTQLAGAAGNGQVLLAQVVDRRFEWKSHEAMLIGPRRIRITDLANESIEEVEFAKDRVVEMGLGFDYLVVATSSQCSVYNMHNRNTPIIFDIKAPPHFMHLCKKHFMMLDPVSGIQVLSYEGRVVCAPKFQGMRGEYVRKELVALAPDTLVVVESVSLKTVYVFDSSSGKELGKITHTVEISMVALNQHNNGPHERIVAFTDRNCEFFVASLACNVAAAKGPVLFRYERLHSLVESFLFNDETDALVGVCDGRLLVWTHPAAQFVDSDLLPLSTYTIDSTELGRNAKIIAYTGSKVSIRKVDGSIVFVSTLAEIPLLYEFARADQWEQCVRLCRHQASHVLWGALSSMSVMKKQLETAIKALSELNEVVKVEYLQFVLAIPSEEGRQAEMALFRRQPDEAERVLLQASPPLVYRAIKMNIRLYRWVRALDLAVKNRSHVDTVLAYRKSYLDDFARQETDPKFVQYNGQVAFDWDTVKAKEHKELETERSRGSGNRK